MKWLRKGGWFSPRTLYFSADDIVSWTRQLEDENGPSEGLSELRDLIEHFRSRIPE